MSQPNPPAAQIDRMQLGQLQALRDRGDTEAQAEIDRILPAGEHAFYERAALQYRADRGDTRAAATLAGLYPEAAHQPDIPPAQASVPASGDTPPPAVDLDALRAQVLQAAGLQPEDAVLLTGATAEELLDQANALRALDQRRAPRLPAFAPNPGQAAGTAAPPAPSGMQRGRDLYAQERASNRPRWMR